MSLCGNPMIIHLSIAIRVIPRLIYLFRYILTGLTRTVTENKKIVKPIISNTLGQFPADRAFSNKRATRLRAKPVSVYLSYLGIRRRRDFCYSFR